jgi:hypothetical protein
MADILFTSRVALDPATGTLARNAQFQVYAIDDTTYSTPLSITDPTGVPISAVRSTDQGVTEPFKAPEGHSQVVLRSGSYAIPIDSLDAIDKRLDGVEQSVQAAESSAASAAASAESAVRSVNGTFPDPTGNVEISVSGGGTGTGGDVTWGNLPGRPATFPPSGHSHPRSEISDATALGRQLLGATDAQSARAIIQAGTGNGTSNLTLGTSATTAAPGNHTHPQYVDQAQAAAIADARIAASGGGGGGGSILVWRYQSGAYPALPSTAPAGVALIHAIGPLQPSSVPSWVGNEPGQVPAEYIYNGGLT